MRKSKLFLTVLMLTTAGWATAQKQWTLEDCIKQAMEHNLTLKQAHLNTASAEEDVKGARSALLPSVSASTNHSVGYHPWQESSSVTLSDGGTDGKVDKFYYNGSYGINMSWTVWDGNKNLNTLKQNKLSAEQAKLTTKVTANSIQEEIAKYYVQLLYLKEAVKVSEQNLETSLKNEERGKQMMEVGKMSKADVAQLSAQRATDEYNIVQARANISLYLVQLKQLLELDMETPFDVSDPTASDELALREFPSVNTVFEKALLTRPEIAASELEVKSSELSVKMAKAGYYPTLSMTGGVGTSTNSMATTPWGKQMKSNFDASAGLTLTIPIYDRRQTKTAIRKAKIMRQQAEIEVQNYRDDLYKTIESYWIDAETNQQKLRAAIATEQSEQLSYDLLQEQFDLGLKNIVELMTGKDKLLTAQQNKLQSKYQTILAQQMLKFYAGERQNQ